MIRSRFLSWLGRICSLWGLILMVMVCGCGKADRDFTFPVVITINNGDWGQVQSQPEGISCPDDCVEYYLEGTQLTLTAIPENWSKFEVWKGDCQGTDPIILVDVSDALTCAAEFAELAGTLHILSIEVRGSGTGTVMSLPTGIQCPDDCDQAFEENTQVTLIAVSQEGSQFEGWAGDCEGLQPQISIDMDASKSCTANFSFISEDSFALDLVLAGDGSGSAAAVFSKLLKNSGFARMRL